MKKSYISGIFPLEWNIGIEFIGSIMKAFGDEGEDLIRKQKEHRLRGSLVHCPWGMVLYTYKYGILVHKEYGHILVQ